MLQQTRSDGLEHPAHARVQRPSQPMRRRGCPRCLVGVYRLQRGSVAARAGAARAGAARAGEARVRGARAGDARARAVRAGEVLRPGIVGPVAPRAAGRSGRLSFSL